jgi:ESCRT-I complex subunit VPS28
VCELFFGVDFVGGGRGEGGGGGGGEEGKRFGVDWGLMAYGEQREVRLWRDKREREMYDNFADLFAIIKTTEKLEKAYVRDVVSAKEYEPACSKLIAQFRTLKTALKDSVPDVEQFVETYKMDCPAAVNRLLVSGIPANVEHKSASSSSDSGTAAAVAECVQIFITAMDTLKLNMLAVDQVWIDLLNPLFSNKCSSMSLGFPGFV